MKSLVGDSKKQSVKPSRCSAGAEGPWRWEASNRRSARFRFWSSRIREKDLLGSRGHPNTFRVCIELVAAGKINVRPIITHTLPLGRVERGIQLMRERQEGAIKIILAPQKSTRALNFPIIFRTAGGRPPNKPGRSMKRLGIVNSANWNSENFIRKARTNPRNHWHGGLIHLSVFVWERQPYIVSSTNSSNVFRLNPSGWFTRTSFSRTGSLSSYMGFSIR